MTLNNIYNSKKDFFRTYDEFSLKNTYGVPTGVKFYDSLGNVLGNHPKAYSNSVILSLNGNSGIVETTSKRGCHSLALAMNLANLDSDEIKAVDSVLRNFGFRDAHCGRNLNDAPKFIRTITSHGGLVSAMDNAEDCMKFCMSDDEINSSISDKDRINVQRLINYK